MPLVHKDDKNKAAVAEMIVAVTELGVIKEECKLEEDDKSLVMTIPARDARRVVGARRVVDAPQWAHDEWSTQTPDKWSARGWSWSSWTPDEWSTQRRDNKWAVAEWTPYYECSRWAPDGWWARGREYD